MSSFNDLYKDELSPGMFDLEKMRVKVRLKFILLWLAFIICFAGTLYVVKSESKADDWMSLLFFVLIMLLVVVYYHDKSEEKYNKAYDSKIVDEIIKSINPKWQIAPRHNETKEFWGEIDGVSFRCSDKRNHHFNFVSLGSFGRGFFFKAELNKKLSGKTHILPDKSEKKYGRIARSAQRRTTGLRNDFANLGKLIELENLDFEKNFVVYGTKPIESRYILTPLRMEAILRIKNIITRPVYIVYSGKSVYVHFHSFQFTKPPVYRSVYNKKRLNKMYSIVNYCNEIVKELGLNDNFFGN